MSSALVAPMNQRDIALHRETEDPSSPTGETWSPVASDNPHRSPASAQAVSFAKEHLESYGKRKAKCAVSDVPSPTKQRKSEKESQAGANMEDRWSVDYGFNFTDVKLEDCWAIEQAEKSEKESLADANMEDRFIMDYGFNFPDVKLEDCWASDANAKKAEKSEKDCWPTA